MIALNVNQKSKEAQRRVRPLDLRRDVAAVAALLELVFHQQIGRASRQALAPSYPAGWMILNKNAPVPGFVYEIDKRIVGNVSLIESQPRGRYLVANVAVHPDFRRQGIARHLMQEVITYVHSRQGKMILLQVEENNQGALQLYRSLQFREVGTSVIWQLSHYQLRPLAAPQPIHDRQPDQYNGFALDTLRSNDWSAAYQLDIETFPLDMQWPEPINRTTYKTSWWKKIMGFINGQQQEVWTARANSGNLIGLAAIDTMWGRPHILRLRLDPEWGPRIARPLLAKVMRRLRYLSRRPIMIDHLKDDALVEPLLQEAGFQKRRTLTTMKYLVPQAAPNSKNKSA